MGKKKSEKTIKCMLVNNETLFFGALLNASSDRRGSVSQAGAKKSVTLKYF